MQIARGKDLKFRRTRRNNHRPSITDLHMDVGRLRRGSLRRMSRLGATEHRPCNCGECDSKQKKRRLKEANSGPVAHYDVPFDACSIPKEKEIFRTISQAMDCTASIYRISASECSRAPRLGVGIAPTSLATHAPTRLATSFIRSSGAPC